jgi:hypothetical protein
MLSQIKKKIEFSSLWVCKSTLKYIELILINSFNSTYSDCLMKMKNFSEHVLNCCRAFRLSLLSPNTNDQRVYQVLNLSYLKLNDILICLLYWNYFCHWKYFNSFKNQYFTFSKKLVKFDLNFDLLHNWCNDILSHVMPFHTHVKFCLTVYFQLLQFRF